MTSQVIQGAGQGAAAGYKVGGGWGAVIGAVVGGIGGAFGDKADKYKRKATKEEQRSVEMQHAAQRRAIWRSMYLARQEAIAASAAQEGGGLQSYAPQGVVSSISTKGTSNLMLFDALIARQRMGKYYMKKAGKNQGYSDFIMGAIASVGGSGMSFGGGQDAGPGGGSSSGSSSSGSSGGGGGAGNSFFTMDMGSVSD
jgi:hypothetical protein